VLIEGRDGEPTVLDHLGVEVETTDEVRDATARLGDRGLFTQVEDDTTCCYALQDKVWVDGPGKEPWEVYTVKADAPTPRRPTPRTSPPPPPASAALLRACPRRPPGSAADDA
jgi:hypothetical protein